VSHTNVTAVLLWTPVGSTVLFARRELRDGHHALNDLVARSFATAGVPSQKSLLCCPGRMRSDLMALHSSRGRAARRQVVVLGRLAYNLRNNISICNVEMIVASVCRCNSTGCAPIFTTSVSTKERKTVSNNDFTVSHRTMLYTRPALCKWLNIVNIVQELKYKNANNQL